MKKTTMSNERQAPSLLNNLSPCSIIQFNRVIKKAITVNHMHLNRKLKTRDFTLREIDLKSDITSLDLRYNFCTDWGIFLSEISWLETEIHKNVQEGKIQCQCS